MSVIRKDLLGQLRAISSGIPKNLPDDEETPSFILHDGKVYSDNGEFYCTIECVVKDVSANIPASVFLNLLEKLKDEEINIRLKDDGLVINGKNKRAIIVVTDVDTVFLESVEKEVSWQEFHEDFTKAVRFAIPCAGGSDEDETNRVVHIHPQWVEACGSFEIGRYTIQTGFSESILILAETIKHIVDCDMQEFAISSNRVHFRNEAGLCISCLKYDDVFVDTEEVLGKGGDKVSLPIETLTSLDIASIFTTDEYGDAVSVNIEGKGLMVIGKGKLGSYEERRKLKETYPHLSFMISVKSFKNVLRKANNCEVGDDFLKVTDGNFVYMTQLEPEEDGN